jgi:hypothetical protein
MNICRTSPNFPVERPPTSPGAAASHGGPGLREGRRQAAAPDFKGVPSDWVKAKMAVKDEVGFFSNRHLIGI